MNEFEILTFEKWSKEFKSFIDAQLHSLNLETDEEDANDLAESIQYNTKMLMKGERLKNEAIFYRQDGVLSYKIVGREMKRDFEEKINRGSIAYV